MVDSGQGFGAPVSKRYASLLAALFLLLAAGILAAGAVFYHRQWEQRRAFVHAQLLAVADLKANELTRWRQERLRTIGLVAQYVGRNPVVQELIRDVSQPGKEAELRGWLAPLAQWHAGALIVATNGAVISASPPELGQRAAVEPALVRQAVADGQPAMDLLREDAATGQAYLDMVAPVRWAGAATVCVVFRIDAENFLFPYIQRWPTPSATAETLLVRREGDRVLFLNDLRHRPDTSLRLTHSLDSDLPAAQAVRGRVGIVEARDYRGTDVVAAVRPVPGSGWFLVAKVDAAEVYAPQRAAAVRTALAVIGLILASGFALAWLWSRREAGLAERLALATKYAHDAVLLATMDGRIVECNERLAEMHGRPATALLQMTFRDLRPPELRDRVAADRQLLQPGNTAVFETVHQRADGSVFPVEVSARVITIDRRLYRMEVLRDSTHRKRAEEQLQLQAAALRAAANAIVITDTDGIIESANPAFTKLTGFTEKDALGHHTRLLKSGRQGGEFYQNLWATIRAGEVWRGELINKRKDGTEYFEEMTITPVRDATGVVRHYIAVKEDITARKQAEAALRASELFYRQTLEGIPGMVFTTRPDGFCEYQSRQWVEYTGVPMHEHIGTGWNRLLHPDDAPRALAAWEAAVAGRAPYDLEYRVRRHDGVYEWFKVIGHPIRDAEGRVVRWFGVATNIDALKRAQQQLQDWADTLETRVAERTAELTATNKELESFTYTIAHDLRAPMRHVIGFITILGRSANDRLSEMERESLANIKKAATRMGQLVDDLLAFARLGRAPLQRAPVDLAGLVADVRQQLAPDVDHRQVEWQIGPLPVVEADPHLLHQVFYNVLHNAVKFTRPRPVARIEVRDESTPTEHIIAIRDNGVGFDMAHASKLFGVFERLHHERDFEGTGIGLAHVQRILHRHDGRVWAEARPGAGATIHIALPRPQPQAQQAA